MYAYNFKPSFKGINFKELFVVMPFDKKYDPLFDDLVKPATFKANKILGLSGHQVLEAFRTKDDISTTSGWINVLEHLLTAQVVVGVLTDNNPNVFYELGIAHSTEPISRQILLANKGHRVTFDIKDLIYYEYEDNLEDSIDPLALRISDAIKTYKFEQEKRIHQARMMVGPYGFEVLMTQGSKRNFALHTSIEGRKAYEQELLDRIQEAHLRGCSERHIQGIQNLCEQGMLGFNTSSRKEGEKVIVSFAYHWTELGNSILHLLELIPLEELRARRETLPAYFSS